MSTILAPHPIRQTLAVEVSSFLVGTSITFALFLSMAHSAGEADQPYAAPIEDLRAIVVPPEPPPPAPEVAPTENVMPMEFTGLEVSASESPVKIEVNPLEFDQIVTMVAPRANIIVNQVYHDFKPGLDYSNDPQRVYQKADLDVKVTAHNREWYPIPRWVRQRATVMQATVLFVVERNGSASNVRIVKTSGNKDFDEIVVRSLTELWTFTPGMRRGKTVRSITQQVFIIKWESGIAFEL